jgi:hypothetical protein
MKKEDQQNFIEFFIQNKMFCGIREWNFGITGVLAC